MPASVVCCTLPGVSQTGDLDAKMIQNTAERAEYDLRVQSKLLSQNCWLKQKRCFRMPCPKEWRGLLTKLDKCSLAQARVTDSHALSICNAGGLPLEMERIDG